LTPQIQAPVSQEQDTDVLDLAAIKDSSLRMTTTRAQWNQTPKAIQDKWNVVNARGVAPTPALPPPQAPSGTPSPMPTSENAPAETPSDNFNRTPWMNLHDGTLPTYSYPLTGDDNVQQVPSTHEIVQASQIIQNGAFVPGQDLQPIDNRTAEAMFSPENLQAVIPSSGLVYPVSGRSSRRRPGGQPAGRSRSWP
jgi:hypothetical protein